VTISNQQFTPEILAHIQALSDANPGWSRRKLSMHVCEWLQWRSPNGKLKDMSCRVALLELERADLLHLPPAGPAPPKRTPRRSVPLAGFQQEPAIQCSLSELGDITLVLINGSNTKASRQWNELMNQHHYLGGGPLCGAQLRYLIQSYRYGYVGGFAFSAAAWRLAPREQWIGWDDRARRQNLNRVVNNSRFLIVPHVQVKNLASHVLALVTKRLAPDWRERYGLEPVLVETFVKHGRFTGASYRAANWIHLGLTQGRGRQDKTNQYAVPVKDIYIYPLRPDAQAILCDGPRQEIEIVAPPPREPVDWADEEFGAAELGDVRRVKRLLTIGRDFYAQPQANIPQASGTPAKTKAAYRFLDDPYHTMDKLLAPHYEATLNRVAKEKVVLAAQDTTYLNYTAHPDTDGLGPIGNRNDGGAIGLVLHDTMTFNLDGTPLGLMNVQCWAREFVEAGSEKRRPKELPIEEKESNKWLVSYRAVAAAQKRCPQTMLVSVGDREADIYELFHEALSDPQGPKLLIRADRVRLLNEGRGQLWDYVTALPVCGKQHVQVPRQGKRPKREAELEIRFAKVTLKPPELKPELGELTLWAIAALEVNYAAEVEEPIEWLLLTTLVVENFEQAAEKLNWYAKRWGIEVYHRTLKSGCKIEERQLGRAERIEACLAIDLVVAWRIFHLTKLGREVPNVPCTVFFEEAEWKALVAYKTRSPIPPETPPTLREAVRMVASLGGFLGRKCDGEPGTKSLWLGLQRLDDLTAMWKIVTARPSPPNPERAVSSEIFMDDG
jgi:hypothetical protein